MGIPSYDELKILRNQKLALAVQNKNKLLENAIAYNNKKILESGTASASSETTTTASNVLKDLLIKKDDLNNQSL